MKEKDLTDDEKLWVKKFQKLKEGGMVREISLDRLREEFGIEFPSGGHFKQVNAGISLNWLVKDAGLSEKERNAIEGHLRGEKRIGGDYYRGIEKLKKFVAKLP